MQYPLNIELKNVRCVVLGGGHVALRKVRTLLSAEAEVMVIAPEAEQAIFDLAAQGKISFSRSSYTRGDLVGAKLVILATNDSEVNNAAGEEARELGILVNAPKEPEKSDFSVPASVRRGSLLLTVSTGNNSPGLARFIREKLEEDFPEVLSEWLEILHTLREEMKDRLPTSRDREAFWRYALNERLLDMVKQGNIKQAEAEIRNAAYGFEPQS